MEEKINGITFQMGGDTHEDREIKVSATLECLKTKDGKRQFMKLSAKGNYLAGALDNEEELNHDAYYDIRITQSSGVTLPVDEKYNGIYAISFVGRAWIDTRDPDTDEENARPRVYFKGHDFTFAKKANLIKHDF